MTRDSQATVVTASASGIGVQLPAGPRKCGSAGLALVAAQTAQLGFIRSSSFANGAAGPGVDAGTMRRGWPIPTDRLLSSKAWADNRIDCSWSANSVPQNLAIYAVY